MVAVLRLKSRHGHRGLLDSSPTANWKRSLLTAWLTLAIGYIALIPVSDNFVLYPLLFSLGAIAGIGILRNGVRLNLLSLAPAGLWLTFVIYGTVVAIARSAESWPRTLVFLLFWPVFYFVVVIGFKRNLVKVIFSIGAAVTIFISVVFLVGGFVALGHTPISALPPWVISPLGLRIVTDATGSIALTAHSLPPLMWWGAMWVASLACGKRDTYLPPMWIRFIAGSFAIAASIVAWRRGIVLVFVLVPLIMLATWLLLIVRNTEFTVIKGYGLIVVRVVACYAAALVLSMGVQSQVGSMIVNVTRSAGAVLGLSTNVGLPQKGLDAAIISQKGLDAAIISENDQLADKIREGERQALTKWTSAPDAVFGHGIGASVPTKRIFHVTKPWVTELQYHGLYYWTGVIGMILLILTFAASLLTIRRAFRIPDGLRGPLYVSCVGAAATLVGNATNPYLNAPGHMWPVFFPFMIASAILASQPTEGFHGKEISIPRYRRKGIFRTQRSIRVLRKASATSTPNSG